MNIKVSIEGTQRGYLVEVKRGNRILESVSFPVTKYTDENIDFVYGNARTYHDIVLKKYNKS